jgi:hypothetical protein
MKFNRIDDLRNGEVKMKKILKIIAWFLLTIVMVFVILVLMFNGIRWNDIRLQKQHYAQLEAKYAGDYEAIDEQTFVNFVLEASGLRLNEIQMIASHNSYKKLGTGVGKLFIGLGDSFDEAHALRYGNPYLSEQLDDGIRSFELDVRYRRGDFEVTHVPLVDNSSVAVKLELAFAEIALWSEHNPNHIPIILLLELKDDWMMLDPFLQDIGSTELAFLDQLIDEQLGDKLYTAGDLAGTYPTIQDRIDAESWPLVSELLGKIIVVLHPGKWTTPYVAMHERHQDLTMFPAVSNMNVNHDYAAFVVHNDPNIANIEMLINQNLIVRTRMDANLMIDETMRTNALTSGAQLLTTDFHPSHQFEGVAYTYLDGEYTVIRNTILLPEV